MWRRGGSSLRPHERGPRGVACCCRWRGARLVCALAVVGALCVSLVVSLASVLALRGGVRPSPPSAQSNVAAHPGTVRVARGAAERVRLAGDFGEFGFYTRLQHACLSMNVSDAAVFLPRSALADGGERVAPLPPPPPPNLPPWGSANPGFKTATSLGFHFTSFNTTPPLLLPERCFLRGRTLVLENSAGVPGHIGHFAENVFKFFAMLPQLPPRDSGDESAARRAVGAAADPPSPASRASGGVDRLAVLGYPFTLFPGGDWSVHLLRAALGVAQQGDTAAPLPPVMLDPELLRLRDGSSGVGDSGAQPAAQPVPPACPAVCFEEAVWPQVTQKWFMSAHHADVVRDTVYAYCGLSPAALQPAGGQWGGAYSRARPRVLFVPRYRNTRQVRNAEQLVGWARDAGFDVVPPPPNMTHFCAQVELFAGADLVISTHGSQLTNVAWMRPHSVVLELHPVNHYWPAFKVLAAHARVHYLEWRNTDATREDAAGVYFGKQSNMLVAEDVRVFLRHAHALLTGGALWARSLCTGPAPFSDPAALRVRGIEEMSLARCVPPGYAVAAAPDLRWTDDGTLIADAR